MLMTSIFSRTVKLTNSRISQTSRRLLPYTRSMATLGTRFKLNTGAEIPAVGFGTWQDADAQENAVTEALKAGYRHIDTARVYGTEPAVGRAIKKSGIPRDHIFITTKLWNNSHNPEDVEPALNASLKDLDVEYVDLYLIHWPSPFKSGDALFPKDSNGKNLTGDADYIETYKALEEVFKSGKARAIGISNFSGQELKRLLQETTVVPAAHQIELHPWLQQKEFVEFNKSKGIHVTQYSPFGNQNEIYASGKHLSKLIDEPTLVEIGKKYNKNGAQTALAWGINNGHSVLPKSKTPSRIKSNLEGDFKLEPEDLKTLNGLDRKLRFNDDSENFGWNFFVGEDGKK